jgi:ABC-2 type transport system permease protein
MTAILKRELHAYFFTPLGYVFIGVYYLFAGYFFYTYNLFGATTDTSPLFSQLFSVTLFMTPVLTMRLLCEERHLKTERQLFTSPVSRGAIVAGKYFSALIVYVAAISIILVDAVILAYYGKPDWPVIIGNYAGLLMLGCAQIAICLFLSSFTESQFIAVVFGFCVSLLLILIDAVSLLMGGGFLQDLLLAISFNNRYSPFTMGFFDPGGAVYFISVAALFVLLTAAALDKRRWD